MNTMRPHLIPPGTFAKNERTRKIRAMASTTSDPMPWISRPTFPGDVGLEIHGIGSLVVLAIALIFLVLSFFAKVPGGIKWGLIVFIPAIVQDGLGIAGHSVSLR